MKLLALTTLVLAAGFLGGCTTLDTPAYTAEERFNTIDNNIVYTQSQFADDIDHALLLRPASRLCIWDVFHRD